jgi:uncharacterized protein
MGTVLVAVFVASLLGSFHCACMCGPIAIWASGTGSPQSTRMQVVKVSGYHTGRLMTYLVLGAIAGLAGTAVSYVGETAGFQSAAARVAGVTMIAMGIWRLQHLWLRSHRAVSAGSSHGFFARSISKFVASTRPTISKLPVAVRSVGVGATTVLLPCGWLYLFVLFAGGSGSVLASMAVMAAFWLGTVPSLVALVSGTFHLANLTKKFVPQLAPIVGAMLLILFGAHTASGRASADLRKLEQRMTQTVATSVDQHDVVLEKMKAQPLPCCQHE